MTGQNAADQARILNKTPVSPTGATGTTVTTGATAQTPTAGTPTTTPTTPTTQAGPANIDDATFNSILNSIDPNGLYTQDQKNDLRNALAQGRQGIDLATTTAEQKLGAYQNLANAWRMQRDITDQLDQTNIMNQRQVQDLTRQYNQAIDQQKQRMEADANNTSIMQ